MPHLFGNSTVTPVVCRGIVAVLVLVASSGCQSWLDQFRQTPSIHADAASATTENATAAVKLDELESILADGNAWCESIRSGEDGDEAVDRPRWRNRDLENLLSRRPVDRAALRRFLSDDDNVTASNAAIALARLGSAEGEKRLAEAVHCTRLKLPLRLAAAEALASLSSPFAASALGELIDQYGDFRLDRKALYVPRLHAELLLGFSRCTSPENEPRFAEAADSPSADVRLVVAELWSNLAGPSCRLPDAVADLTNDSDPRVRGSALSAVARAAHPQAKDRLQGGLRDGNIHVRLAALEAIGQWHDPSAREMLMSLLQDRSSIMRAAAVAALCAQGAEDKALAAADDESWRVRAAVARSLRNSCDNRSLGVARRLLDDPNLEVQQQMVIAMSAWPLQACGELLLTAMQSDSPRTRKLAAERLAERWPPAVHFPYAAVKSRREEAISRLRDEFARHHERLKDDSLQKTSCDADTAVVPLADDVAIELISSLEKSDDCLLRRRAAAKLASLAVEKPLSVTAVASLATAIAGNGDQLVWQYALDAVARDGSPTAAALAYAAIRHDSPEVRRRACEHLAAHPSARHADFLLTVINDPHPSVAKAAVDALGRAGRKTDARELKDLLLGANASLRLETAVALQRLGNSEATAELRRLALDDDPQIRREVARAMGRCGQRHFTANLIRMLDDRAGVRRQALESLERLHSDNSPLRSKPGQKTTSQQIELWKRWYEDQYSFREP